MKNAKKEMLKDFLGKFTSLELKDAIINNNNFIYNGFEVYESGKVLGKIGVGFGRDVFATGSERIIRYGKTFARRNQMTFDKNELFWLGGAKWKH